MKTGDVANTAHFRRYLRAGPKAEKAWPRDVLLTVSHSKLTLCCSWYLILILLNLPDCSRVFVGFDLNASFSNHYTNGAMNGSTNPLLDKEEHVLKLGESFEKRPKSSFHTIRCKCDRLRDVLNKTLAPYKAHC